MMLGLVVSDKKIFHISFISLCKTRDPRGGIFGWSHKGHCWKSHALDSYIYIHVDYYTVFLISACVDGIWSES